MPVGMEKPYPHPTEQGEVGRREHYLVVEAKGIPLSVTLTVANVHDARMML
jgi:hypothetical protein